MKRKSSLVVFENTITILFVIISLVLFISISLSCLSKTAKGSSFNQTITHPDNISPEPYHAIGKDSIGKDEWKAPAWTDTLTNPFANDVEVVEKGKKVYNKMCWTCHGKSGKGDGPAGASLNPKPKDHTSDKVQQQSDGALFWKITTGDSPMASYEKILTKEERWQLVSYIRTLGSNK
ncbi:MAG: cytochrome c [Cytophagales bacterium]|nr:cytochrome c [Cytophagales bacterium]